jgi:hypothetical protein
MRRLIFVALLMVLPLLALGAQPASACWGYGMAATAIPRIDPLIAPPTPIDRAMPMPAGVGAVGGGVVGGAGGSSDLAVSRCSRLQVNLLAAHHRRSN